MLEFSFKNSVCSKTHYKFYEKKALEFLSLEINVFVYSTVPLDDFVKMLIFTRNKT